MSEITGAATIIQPALQQTQVVKQPDATDARRGQDPNEGSRALEVREDAIRQRDIDDTAKREIKEDAIRQRDIDEAAKRAERGQELNITV